MLWYNRWNLQSLLSLLRGCHHGIISLIIVVLNLYFMSFFRVFGVWSNCKIFLYNSVKINYFVTWFFGHSLLNFLKVRTFLWTLPCFNQNICWNPFLLLSTPFWTTNKFCWPWSLIRSFWFFVSRWVIREILGLSHICHIYLFFSFRWATVLTFPAFFRKSLLALAFWFKPFSSKLQGANFFFYAMNTLSRISFCLF